ncbi:MAG: polyprenyl synthetase family protein [Paludibacterium sp.]|uniref:polyprenyl synthetase family protein n=1 Tax=Paludibacterium sp. TaxID=1917523 RepID=UPI002600B330|nr:polyprenyl synthetase family protein [Paludibacterium sp.]MBV8049072.1 polyprenyl synthetase family protein [Paludibacterium sp.]MBV8649418.1 polyprenyl synthetase family protein [Paludibacterium sp.]
MNVHRDSPQQMPAALERLRQRIDDCLAAAIAEQEQCGPERDHPLIGRVYRWLRHYLDCDGKRMHGIAVLLAHRACDGDEAAIEPVAAALQLYHHHTLVHDDIYDEDSARRGWPTVHQAFADWFGARPGGAAGAGRVFVNGRMRRGVITAFAYGKVCRALAGRLLLGSRFDAGALLDVARALEAHELFDNAAQLKDVFHEGGAMPAPEACLDNARLKTGRLFELCAYAGARLAGAGVGRQQALARWAGSSALAYQLQDDLADLDAASEKGQGRGVASDLLHCKPTYLYALAKMLAEGADRDALFAWQAGNPSALAHGDIIAILHRCGAVEACRAEVARHIEAANAALMSAQPALRPEWLSLLSQFSAYFVSRAYWHRPLSQGARPVSALLA